jgi:hypothetical protein
MILEELIRSDTQLYAKSEWAPASWAVARTFVSQRGVANGFGGIYRQGRDFVITVGTENPNDTLDGSQVMPDVYIQQVLKPYDTREANTCRYRRSSGPNVMRRRYIRQIGKLSSKKHDSVRSIALP